MTIVESLLMRKAAKLSPRQKVLRLPTPPKARHPIEIERRYYADLKRMLVDKLNEIARRFLLPAIPSILSDARGDLRQDSYGQIIDTIFGTMKVAFARELTEQEISELTKKYASQGQNFNKLTLGKTMQKVLGVDPIIYEPYLDPIMKQFIDQNTNLIKSIGTEFFDKVQQDTYKAVQAGVYNKAYAKEIKAQYEQEFQKQFEIGVLEKRVSNADSRANLIARDQIAKYNSQLNQTRQTALGITKYRWVTSGDDRVRDTHKRNNGKIFSWNNPPSDTGNPGDDINCRCIAEPVFDEGVTDNKNLLKLLES